MKNIPKKVFLQIGDEVEENFDFKDIFRKDICWHSERVFNNDIEYNLGDAEKEQDEEVNALVEIVETGLDWKWGEDFWAVKVAMEVLKKHGYYIHFGTGKYTSDGLTLMKSPTTQIKSVEKKQTFSKADYEAGYNKGYGEGYKDATNEAREEIKEHYHPNK